MVIPEKEEENSSSRSLGSGNNIPHVRILKSDFSISPGARPKVDLTDSGKYTNSNESPQPFSGILRTKESIKSTYSKRSKKVSPLKKQTSEQQLCDAIINRIPSFEVPQNENADKSNNFE